MNITLLQVGKTKEKAYVAIEDEFLKRLTPFCKLTARTVPVSTTPKENEALRAKWPTKGTVVALDSGGEAMTSEQFADFLREERDFRGGEVTFVIGGPHGLEPDLRTRANRTLSLSRMTFTHQMVRLFLLEQIYRGFTIVEGRNYHH